MDKVIGIWSDMGVQRDRLMVTNWKWTNGPKGKKCARKGQSESHKSEKNKKRVL